MDASSSAWRKSPEQNVANVLREQTLCLRAEGVIPAPRNPVDRPSLGSYNSNNTVPIEPPGSAADDSEDEHVFEAQPAIRDPNARKLLGVLVPDLIYPKSAYHGWEPPFPVTTELDALRELVVRIRDIMGHTKLHDADLAIAD